MARLKLLVGLRERVRVRAGARDCITFFFTKGGNFVLAKVCWGLITVRCPDLRCPLLGGSKCITSIQKSSGGK